jgi:ubiquitin C-terminal hydrolase
MWEADQKSISPDDFLQFMRKALPQFGGYQQQDAQEFLRALLDKMHCELETRKGRTMIMQLFQGHFMNQITCDSCKRLSKKEEAFLDLSLSIPETNLAFVPPTLAQCILQFIAAEKLTETDKYYCESCKKLQTATKQMILERLPPVIGIH